MIIKMDNWLARYAAITINKYKNISASQEGTGAAGGLGFAFLACHINEIIHYVIF